jgi:MFS family permease
MRRSRQKTRLLLIASVGGVLEFYDFIIYALFAHYIAQAFFPLGNPILSLMATFASFGVGYLARPVGGIMCGHFGDRLGRKKTFSVLILVMSLATFLMGSIPSYASMGIAAPLLMIVLRVIQGLSLGGELPGVITYVSESMSWKKGWANGVVFFVVGSGLSLGALTHAILQAVLLPSQMHAWGWRLPFWFSGVLGVGMYRLRRVLFESPSFQKIHGQTARYPIATLLRDQRVGVWVASMMMALVASVNVLLFVFISSYVSHILQQSVTHFIWYFTAASLLSNVFALLSGYWLDYLPHRRVMWGLTALVLLFAFPIFYPMRRKTPSFRSVI